MASIENVKKLIDKLKKRQQEAQSSDGNPVYAVGYFGTGYAHWVHEMMEMKHSGEPRPSGLGEFWGPSFYGPKFLENPAKELRPEFKRIIAEAAKAGKTLAQGILIAALRLQRESMQRCPREYGNLVQHAETRREK